MSAASQLGANCDNAVDCAFISGMFLYFVLSGIYPFWVLIVIIGMFLQYIVTSKLMKIAFDPIGKYYGSLLYGAIGLTMLFKGQIAQSIILYSLLAVSIVTVLGRVIYMIDKCSRNKRSVVSKKRLS